MHGRWWSWWPRQWPEIADAQEARCLCNEEDRWWGWPLAKKSMFEFGQMKTYLFLVYVTLAGLYDNCGGREVWGLPKLWGVTLCRDYFQVSTAGTVKGFWGSTTAFWTTGFSQSKTWERTKIVPCRDERIIYFHQGPLESCSSKPIWSPPSLKLIDAVLWEWSQMFYMFFDVNVLGTVLLV